MIEVPPGVRIVLASASPRRVQLLRSLGLDVEVRPADIDESVRTGESPVDYVRRLSVEKAAAASPVPGEVVIGADTTVAVDGAALGKPTDGVDARRMLRSLSGRDHRVHTGVTVAIAGPTHLDAGRTRSSHAATGLAEASRTDVVTTTVRFVGLDDPTIDWYVATGEPFGKAGAYAIQGAGGALVAGVEGSVTNVIGLPLAETLTLLRTVLANPL